VAPASKFARGVAEALGREIDDACSVRTRRGTLAIGIGAGLGAGIGAILGGAVAAGLGGGIGAALGIAAAMELSRRLDPPLAWQMALVLTSEGFELYALDWRGRPSEALVSGAYGELAEVVVEPNWVTLRGRVRLRSGASFDLEATKGGSQSGKSVLSTLSERAGAPA
jgi:hypothetical protein